MNRFALIPFVLTLALAAGCGRGERSHDGSSHEPGAGAKAHAHEHKAPHGGALVVLGAEEFHLELVRDAKAGTLTAYVLDGEMENFIRLPIESFTVTAQVDGGGRPLRFEATGSRATGEKPGDTSMFVAQADWLKTLGAFEAVLVSLEVRGRTYRDVRFSFPPLNSPASPSRL